MFSLASEETSVVPLLVNDTGALSAAGSSRRARPNRRAMAPIGWQFGWLVPSFSKPAACVNLEGPGDETR